MYFWLYSPFAAQLFGVELTFGPYPESYTPTQIYFLKLNNLFTVLLVLLHQQ